MRRIVMVMLVGAVVACGPVENDRAANQAAAPVAPTVPSAPAPKPQIVLSGDGLGPGLGFGSDGKAVSAALAEATGKSGVPSELSECGQGPLTQIAFGAINVTLIEGRFQGWFQSKGEPALKTADGLTIGSPRSALGATRVEESTIGLEFVTANGIAGLLDERGRGVESLWAGEVCIFR